MYPRSHTCDLPSPRHLRHLAIIITSTITISTTIMIITITSIIIIIIDSTAFDTAAPAGLPRTPSAPRPAANIYIYIYIYYINEYDYII